MGWKENRRRKRTWYKHYRELANQVADLIAKDEYIAPEAFVMLMFQMYERYRLHGKRRIAQSAYESMYLACRDAGLTGYALQRRAYDKRPDGIPGLMPPEVRGVRPANPGNRTPQSWYIDPVSKKKVATDPVVGNAMDIAKDMLISASPAIAYSMNLQVERYRDGPPVFDKELPGVKGFEQGQVAQLPKPQPPTRDINELLEQLDSERLKKDINPVLGPDEPAPDF